MHRSRLPILAPCDQRWESMSGTGPQRHCAACDRDVLDLSAMPAVAAIDALIARDGRACIRYRTDAAGEIQFAAPPRRPNPIAVAALALTACAGWSEAPATVPPDELGQCIPDAQPNHCDSTSRPFGPDLPNATPQQPTDPPPTATAPDLPNAAPQQPADPRPTSTDLDFTALVESAPTATGDTYVPPDALQRMKAEQTSAYTVTPQFGPVETTIVQGEWDASPTLETSLFDRDNPHPITRRSVVVGPIDPGTPVFTRADLRRMKRELRREARQKRRRG